MKSNMNNRKSTITVTFGDVAENGVGMQQIGEKATRGFTAQEVDDCENRLRQMGYEVERVNLSELLDGVDINPEILASARAENAVLLIVRRGVNKILDMENGADALLAEQQALNWDTLKLNKGKVMNALARHNLCYADNASEPDYAQGRGRVIAFESVPHLNHIRESWPEMLGESAENLKAEGNLYYDVKECAIGFHGDTERRKVVALRLGASFPLHYQWHYKSEPVGPRMTIMLDHGDFYIMSDKSVGNDWKTRNILTLRHAAGSADKYIDAPERRRVAKKLKRERDE